jgi:RNA 3'-terminal phosphate cyclase (ATP)
LSLALQFGIKGQLAAQNIRVMPTFIQTPITPSKSGGIGILLFAETTNHHRIAASTILKIHKTSSVQEQLKCATLQGQQVATRLAEQLANGGVVDEYLADQLIIFMALATSGIQPSTSLDNDEILEYGRCEILTGRPSLHTVTAMRIAETMLGNIIFSTRTISGIGETIVCERKSDTDTKQG